MLEKLYYESKPLLCLALVLYVQLSFETITSWGRLFLWVLAICGILIVYQRSSARGLLK